MDIIGHKNKIQSLFSSCITGRLGHANLFVGPEGVGKKSVAKELARFILCSDKKEESCGRCRHCSISLSNHPNVRLLDGTDGIGIDEIRDLKKFFQLRPFYEVPRVAILDNIQNMTKEAANAFLKLLEEPPLNSYFFLIAPSADNLARTIVSRAALTRFSQVASGELKKWLVKEIKVSQKDADFLVSMAQGRPGLALKCIEFRDLFNKMVGIMQSREMFHWSDWDKKETKEMSVPFVSASVLHHFIKSSEGAIEKGLFSFGKRILQAEALVDNTNVNTRLAWENVFWGDR